MHNGMNVTFFAVYIDESNNNLSAMLQELGVI